MAPLATAYPRSAGAGQLLTVAKRNFEAWAATLGHPDGHELEVPGVRLSLPKDKVHILDVPGTRSGRSGCGDQDVATRTH